MNQNDQNRDQGPGELKACPFCKCAYIERERDATVFARQDYGDRYPAPVATQTLFHDRASMGEMCERIAELEAELKRERRQALDRTDAIMDVMRQRDARGAKVAELEAELAKAQDGSDYHWQQLRESSNTVMRLRVVNADLKAEVEQLHEIYACFDDGDCRETVVTVIQQALTALATTQPSQPTGGKA